MNDYLLALLLGIIEGLTEFLPVSSTAHLRIFEAFVGVDLSNGYWKMFTIVIQLGAILSLPIYFYRRLVAFVSTFPRHERGPLNHPLSLTLVAFVVTAVPAFLLTKVIGKNLENLYVMAGSLLIGGGVMWVVDAMFGKPRPPATDFKTPLMDQMTLPQAIWIGACQILSAVFPGTSRSMSTIAAGQLAGMSRSAALEFSFFLSIPTMVAATGYDLLKTLLHKSGPNPLGAAGIDAHGWMVLAIGFVVSFIVALGVVAWFMNWVRRRGFMIFAIYRLLFGGWLLAMLLGRGGLT